MPADKRIKIRRGTAAQWATAESSTAQIADGEVAWVDNDLVKGDGTTKAASLPRAGSGTYAPITDPVFQRFPIIDYSGADTQAPILQWSGYNAGHQVGIDTSNSPKSRDFVLWAKGPYYYINDAVTTSGSATLTSAAEGGFTAAYVGTLLTGAGIPAGTTIASVASATSLTMSAAATATGTGVRVKVGNDASQSGAFVQDIIYAKHRGGLRPLIGLGKTPPSTAATYTSSGPYQVEVFPGDGEPNLGGLSVEIPAGQTAPAIAVVDAVGKPYLSITPNGTITNGYSYATRVKAASGATNALEIVDTGGTVRTRVTADGNTLATQYVRDQATTGPYMQLASTELQLRRLDGTVVAKVDNSALKVVAGLFGWDAAGEQTTVGAAGAAAAVPANPSKYFKVRDNAGTTYVIPAFAAS